MMQLLIGRITGAISPLQVGIDHGILPLPCFIVICFISQLLIAGDWFYTTFVHTISLGDGLVVAPDGEMICPRVEPISEEIKYRLFDLEIAEADVYIYDVGNLTRLQSAGLDLQMCTFHKNEETMTLSWQLQSLTVTGLLPDPQEPSVSLQVGFADLNNLQGSLTLQEPLECVPERQLNFLRKADIRTRRLWFLWNEEGLCGCCGGCLFMDSCITWNNPIARSESAVYGPQFAPFPSIPRHMGFGGLDQTLLLSNISELECMWALHKGLLTHYQARYVNKSPLLKPHLSEERSSKAMSSRPVSCSDASFVSARSSLTSLLGEEYRSVNDITVEEVVSRKTQHKRKPSKLNIDARATGQNQVDNDDPYALHTTYHGIVGSHFLHVVTLQIPCHATTELLKEADTSPPYFQASEDLPPKPAKAQPHHTPTETPTKYKVHHRRSASDTSFMIRGSPDTEPSSTCHFHVYVPCLAPETTGSLPLITQTAATQTLERRRRVNFKQQQSDSKQKAKVALFVQLSASNHLLLSPPFLKIIIE